MSPTKSCLLASVAALVTLSAAGAEDAETDVMLVMDGSGSMWGQIAGTAKIEIAREAVGEVVDSLADDRRLGLVAYGHNREGDCRDIETLVDLGGARTDIRAAINAISPKGKTPLSDAVIHAADALSYSERKATVVLVSDGIETCGQDPCAVGAALEKAGVDFTAHVIGFNVVEPDARAQLACLANETGGRFLTADDADSLSDALDETVAKAPEAASTGTFTLQATDLEGGPVIESGLAWRVTKAGGGDEVFVGADLGAVNVELPAGAYDITVTRTADGVTASLDVEALRRNENRVVTLPLEVALSASLSVTPEGIAPAGSDIAVSWEGPKRKGDYIRVGRESGDRFVSAGSVYVSEGNPLTLRMPVEPAEYVVQYVLGRPTTVLAEVAITAAPVEASLTAPDAVPNNTSFSVAFTGPEPGRSDYITIVTPDTRPGGYLSYEYTNRGSPVEIRSPVEPGDYEVRFVQGGTKVLARAPITVEGSSATLDAPESAASNTSISVSWTGPATSGDFITIVAPDASAGGYKTYSYAQEGKSPVDLATPLEPGDYELRYVQGRDNVLARQPIRIDGASASLEAPASLPANTEIVVSWTGPASRSDFITIVEPGAGDSAYTTYGYPKDGEPELSFTTPLEPGAYELRYVQGGRQVLARQPITVDPVEASLSGPESVSAGSTFSVTFEGPDHRADFVTIVKPDARESSYASYHYARGDSPADLTAPDEPGLYELRYVHAGRRVIARRPIEVTQ